MVPRELQCGANAAFSEDASLCAPIGLDSNWYSKPAGPVGHRSTQTASSVQAIPPLTLLPPTTVSSLRCVAVTCSCSVAWKRTYRKRPSVATVTVVGSSAGRECEASHGRVSEAAAPHAAAGAAGSSGGAGCTSGTATGSIVACKHVRSLKSIVLVRAEPRAGRTRPAAPQASMRAPLGRLYGTTLVAMLTSCFSSRSPIRTKPRPCSFQESSVVGPSCTYEAVWFSKDVVCTCIPVKSVVRPAPFSNSEIVRIPSL